MKTWKQSTFIGIMAILVLAFALVACDDGNGDNDGNGNGNGTGTQSLDGVWKNSAGTLITVSGTNGIYSSFVSPNALWQDAITKGHVKLGDQHWKGLTSTGTLAWSGQQLGITFSNSAPNVATGTGWVNATYALSADGQTLSVTGTSTQTWTRSSYTLDGVWENSGGTLITVSGTNGIYSSFGSPNALWQDAITKGHVKLDDQHWKGLTNTGTLTWSGQQLGITFSNSAPNVATGTGWVNATFTLSANGQTLSVTGTSTATWTRKQ